MTNDLELLRRYEPIVRYTQGEMFLPCPVEPYVERCSLWTRPPNGPPAEVVPAGRLTMESLCRYASEHQEPMFLRFVDKPLGRLEYERWRANRPPFHGSGRLARVGLGPRFLDSLFSLSLLLRGRVPGGTAARASIQYGEMREECPCVPYYGRVVRREGYIVLQYLFFYAMNDWRSSFFGVNDHEADWEQLFVYLEDVDGGAPRPVWLACAAHDYSGDDLRRRWDDPELHIVDGHPVVYAGAGSHATYFKPGEYLSSVEIKPLRPLVRAAYVVRRIWRDVLGQGEPAAFVKGVEALVRVPFVDYARGDGSSVGPGQAFEWSPAAVSDDVDWVVAYRGLWGLDTEDIFSGEQAPAGPRFTRDGSVRQSWYDPLGWAGLNKVAPPSRAGVTLDQRVEELRTDLQAANGEAETLREQLPRLEVESRLLRADPQLRAQRTALERELAKGEAELNRLEARAQELSRSIETISRQRDCIRAGDMGDPRAHIRRSHEPEPADAARQGRLAETWAALSIGLLLLTAVALIRFGSTDTIAALVTLVGGAILVDNILRGTLRPLLLNTSIVLAVITTLILVYEFFWQMALAGIAAIGLILVLQNIRRLRGR